jgi:hypothetical protein
MTGPGPRRRGEHAAVLLPARALRQRQASPGGPLALGRRVSRRCRAYPLFPVRAAGA